MTTHRRRRTSETLQPFPLRQGLAVTRPGVVVEAQVFQGGQRVQALSGQLYQRVVEQVEGGETFQVMEGQAVDPLNLVLVQKQSVQSSEASEGVLVNAPQAVSMQEQVAQVVEVHKCVILQELQMILLREKHNIKIIQRMLCSFQNECPVSL